MFDDPSMFVTDASARRATRELRRLRRREPWQVSTIMHSPWHVPVRWFVLFDDDERRLLEVEGHHRLSYLTTTRKALRRAEDAVPVLRQSELGPIGELVVEMHQWLALFDPGSILELDYGGLCAMLTWDEMDDDHSARDIHDALKALARQGVPALGGPVPVGAGALGGAPRARGPELIRAWPGADSNCRHRGFQPRALPTELPGHSDRLRAPALRPPPAARAPDGLRSRDLRLDRAVRTAGLLYGRVCAIRLCAPNGIRTRVAALKGRNPRPLDDGGPVRAAPRPRPGGSAGKYSGRPLGPSAAPTIRSRSPGRRSTPSAHSRTWRMRGRGSRSRPGRTGRTDRTTSSRSSRSDRDREAHPERVDRTGAIEQEHVVGAHPTATPAAHPFATRLGPLGSQDLGARTEQPDLAHRTTLAPVDDMPGGRSVVPSRSPFTGPSQHACSAVGDRHMFEYRSGATLQSSPCRRGMPPVSTPLTQSFISAWVMPSPTRAQKVRCSASDSRLHQASANFLVVQRQDVPAVLVRWW